MFKNKCINENKNQEKKTIKANVSKKYSLDSDDEDEKVNVEDDLGSSFEGQEEGESKNIGEERFTAFNVQEELEEGHFDRNGYFIWKNEKGVRDNWLDNIDWEKIKPSSKDVTESLGDESDISGSQPFEEIPVYKQILKYMQPRETINKSLRRLGGKSKNLSSIEKLKRKKSGVLHSNTEVIELTELVNMILNETGNIDIYQETYEAISLKIVNCGKTSEPKLLIKEAELDMYAEDFGNREKKKLDDSKTASKKTEERLIESDNEAMYKFKRNFDKNSIESLLN